MRKMVMCSKRKVLVITASLREGSNSEALADAFIEGAEGSGHSIEKITLKDKKIAFCKGCLACQSLGNCVQKDDMNEITEKMRHADVICFATPVYYYNMAGQLKTLLDRSHPLWSSEYRFRDIYLLVTAAADGESVPMRTIAGIEGWVECFKEAEFKGTVFAGGVNGINETANHPAIKKARELGAEI